MDRSRVESFCRELRDTYPDTVVVSGGADGADTFAEQSWRELGGVVVSYRPTPLSMQSWAINKVVLGGPEQGMYRLDLMGHPTWESFEGAAFYRNMVMADEVERAVVFWNGRSRGTRDMMDLMHGRKKPVHMMEAS